MNKLANIQEITRELNQFTLETSKPFKKILTADCAELEIDGTVVVFPEIMHAERTKGWLIGGDDHEKVFDDFCNAVNMFIESRLNGKNRSEATIIWRVLPEIRYEEVLKIEGWPPTKEGYCIYSRFNVL